MNRRSEEFSYTQKVVRGILMYMSSSSGGGPSMGNTFNKWLGTFNLEPGLLIPPMVIMLVLLVAIFDQLMISAIGLTFIIILPFWLPFLLLHHLWTTWIHYIRFQYWKTQDHVLLEITIPQEMSKSPLAMEVFLTSLWNAGGESTFIDRLWTGKFRAVFSLEIASNEGRVAFYLHMRKGMKNIVEARLYGQFPELHVREVEDYVGKIPFNLTDYDLFGAEYAFGKSNAYPIKTYIDYGLDRDPKEEFRIDPITHILELLGQVGAGEYYWMQIILVARKKDQWYGFYSGEDSYAGAIKEAIQGIMQNAAKRGKSIVVDSDEPGRSTQLTDGEKRAIEAIEKKAAKLIFECGIRAVYLAKRDNYVAVNNGGVIRLFDHVKSNEFNSFGPTRGTTVFDYPWQDLGKRKSNAAKMELFSNFRDRAYFYAPYDQVPMLMNTEELATLWHFPGSIVQTPSLGRKLSRTSEAPLNLPM